MHGNQPTHGMSLMDGVVRRLAFDYPLSLWPTSRYNHGLYFPPPFWTGPDRQARHMAMNWAQSDRMCR
jgi:hypothetical protein